MNEKLEMRNGDAAHKNVEAPRSINNSDARRSLDSRFPVLNFPNIVRLTANDKDFSLALEMTIRESDVSKSLSLLVTSHASPSISNAIKLSGRTFLAPHRGSCPKGLCKRTGFLGVKRRENPVRRHFERSEMRGLRSGIA